MRLTVGPLPPAVYWRRRALVLGAALLILFLVVQACMAAGSADNRAGPEPTPDPTVAPPPAPSDPPTLFPEPGEGEETGGGSEDGEDPSTAPDPAECTDEEIRVTAVASQTSFAVGDQVQFTIRIAHAADRACRRDVGGDLRELYLVRGGGAEHVWSSQHCANPSGTDVVELTEGWEREHNIGFTGQSTSECDGAAAAGPDLEPGEYQLLARLGRARSDPVEIEIRD